LPLEMGNFRDNVFLNKHQDTTRTHTHTQDDCDKSTGA
jgi:hypothetical protein